MEMVTIITCDTENTARDHSEYLCLHIFHYFYKAVEMALYKDVMHIKEILELSFVQAYVLYLLALAKEEHNHSEWSMVVRYRSRTYHSCKCIYLLSDCISAPLFPQEL